MFELYSTRVTSRSSGTRVFWVLALQNRKYNLTATWMKNCLKIVCSVLIVLCEIFCLCDCLLMWWSAVKSVYNWIDYVIICYMICNEISKCSMLCTDECGYIKDMRIEMCFVPLTLYPIHICMKSICIHETHILKCFL